MPRNNRIAKNYYLTDGNGRGSIWSVWVTPVDNGPNDIYFAGSGYLRADSDKHGFVFHLSLHKDGRSHIKYKGSKLHDFVTKDPLNFPICSVYTHLEDLKVPLQIPGAIAGDRFSITPKLYKPEDDLKWSELFFVHLEKDKLDPFIKRWGAPDYDFKIIDTVEIGQNRAIYVFLRYIQSTKTTGELPALKDPSQVNERNRLITWGFKTLMNATPLFMIFLPTI